MATKLGSVLTYHMRLLPITSHDSSITGACEVTLLIKYIISPFALD